MAEVIANRISPLLSEAGPEADLSYAPAPWILKQCLETDIIFLANPPAYEELSETYAYEVTFAKETDARKKAEPLRYAISTGLKRFRAKVLKRNKILGMLRHHVDASQSARINVLDVGCGWGELLEKFCQSLPAPLMARVAPHGVEISRELSRLSDERLRPFGGRCEHASAHEGILNFDKDFFDVIVMSSYLEHESQPLAVLANSCSRLTANGVIIIKVPNFDSINRKVRGPRWCGFRWPDHVNYFTPKTLLALAAKAGLEVERMTLLDRNPLSDNMYVVLRRKR